MHRGLKRSYLRLHAFLLGVGRISERYPRLIFLIFIFSFTLMAPGIFRLKTILALEDVVDSSFTSKKQLIDLLHDFKVHNTATLVIEKPAPQGWTDEILCFISEWLTKQRVSNRDLLGSSSAFDVRKTISTPVSISYPRILKLSCLNDPARTRPRQEIEADLREVSASPWGFSTTGTNSKKLLIQFDLADAQPGGRFGTFDPGAVESLHESFDAHLRTFKDQSLILSHAWVGTADFQYYLYLGLKRVNVLNLALMLLLIMFFRWLFGTWRSGFLFTLSSLLAGFTCYGLMGWFNVPIDILSKSLFLMITVAVLEDFVYLCAKTHDLGGNWKKAWRQLLMPGFLTSLTTFMGFISLMVSDLQIIRRFGLWAALGSVIEWLVVFSFYPALFHIFPRASDLIRISPRNGYHLFRRLQIRHLPKPMSVLMLTVFLVTPTALTHLNVKDVPLEMFSEDHQYKRAVGQMRLDDGWETQASLVFQTGVPDEEIRGITKKLANSKQVVHLTGSLDLRDYFTEGVENLQRRDLIRSELSSATFMENWFSRSQKNRYNIFLAASDTDSIHLLEQDVAQVCKPDVCALAGVPVVYSEFSRKIPQTLLESFLLSVFLVCLVLIWLSYCCGKIRSLHWILLSSFWGICLMFTIISAFQVKVNFLTCIFASILVGLTGDNAVQFLVASRRKSLSTGINTGGAAALLSGFLMATSSLIFIGSYFIPPRTLGLLLMLGFCASAIGDYWLLKGLVRKAI